MSKFMNWLNIHTDTLRSEEYLGAEPVERATWLNLMAWCVSQENGGVIEGASMWGERKWMQVCGITKAEATLVSKLFKIGSDGNMVVSLYPSEKEEEVKAKREVARENGKKGGRRPKEPTLVTEETDVGFDKEPTLASGREREGKGKGKEKGMEVPPNPQGGNTGGESNGLQKGCRQWKRDRQKSTRIAANTQTMDIIGSWFGRRPTTNWTVAEAIALADVNPTEDELKLIESYYTAVIKEGDYRRRDALTLLNNWNSELDRARIWRSGS